MKLKIRSWKLSMLIVSLLMTTYFFACQQQSMTEIVDGVNPDQIGEVMTTVDVQADYPGGKSDLYSYISTNLKYPKEAVKNNIEGKVLVEFVINKDGSVSNVSAIKGIGYGCDEEAVRVVESSLNWTPAEHEGEKVRQKLVLPISFKLGNGYSGQEGVDSSKPNYPGGFKAFFQYIQENLKYPSEAKSNNIEGTVHVEFYIEPDGTVTNVKVLRGIGYGCDEEAARVIENSPNWEPTKSEDKAAATKLVIPIQFSAN